MSATAGIEWRDRPRAVDEDEIDRLLRELGIDLPEFEDTADDELLRPLDEEDWD